MNPIREMLRRCTVAVVEWIGPVANSVRDSVNPQEATRIMVKVATTGGLTWGSIKSLAHDPDAQTTIVIPVIVAFFAGTWEYVARKQQGAVKAADDTLPVPLPEPPTEPSQL